MTKNPLPFYCFYLGLALFLFACTSTSEKKSKIYTDSNESCYYETNDIYDFLSPKADFPVKVSAHRGSRYYSGWPENCLESFDFILHQLPAMVECDLRMSRDSVLFLLHDESLDRTTTGSGRADQNYFESIKTLRLKDSNGNATDFHPTALSDLLKWAKGKTILKLDVKPNVPFELVIKEIREAEATNFVVVIVYSLNAAQVFHRMAPEIMISVPVRNSTELVSLKESNLPLDRIVAFTGSRKTEPKVYEELNKLGILAIQGTMGNLDQQAVAKGYDLLKEIYDQGADIIATDHPLELHNFLQ